MEFKKTVAVDFDGVLNTYKGFDPDNLESPQKGCKDFLERLSKYYTIIVFTRRDNSSVVHWLREYHLDKYIRSVTDKKPAAVAYIDDRAICYNGSYDEVLEALECFNPYWMKKEKK